MTKGFMGKAAIFAAALVAGLAMAAPAKAVTYATVVNWTPGAGANVDPTRSNPLNATGAPDGKFLSLGLGGSAIFSFGAEFVSPGSIVEVTFGNLGGYPEAVEVWASTSLDPLTFVSLGLTISNATAQGGAPLAFAGQYLYLMLKDVTAALGGPSTDGFDVDAVSVTVVPLPAGVVLLGSALAGLGFLGRRRKSKQAVAA